MLKRENYPWGKYLLPDDKVSLFPSYDIVRSAGYRDVRTGNFKDD